ncbi:lytic transglycosylase domain-containing protein [Gynuella sunshinyii]|uniref:lytic transglycosylase domain-containing protein n=1 Tax=Gynuella sunshinyii TaxID=1445505 RepID=UPI0009E22993|nr:lytic transglycosylase domain-containing protein [Gynuella sunshinyii]
MTITRRHQLSLFLLGIYFSICSVQSIAYSQETYARQREYFDAASEALSRNDLRQYHKLRKKLHGYLLLDYLDYEYLMSANDALNKQSLALYKTSYQNRRLEDRLTVAWIKKEYQQQHWDVLAETHIPLWGDELRCIALDVQLHTQPDNIDFKNVQKLWNVGKPQSSACDNVFAYWIEKQGVPAPVAFNRFVLALKNDHIPLAQYLSSDFHPPYSNYADIFLKIEEQPQLLADLNWLPKNTPFYPDLIFHGINRLISVDTDTALDVWPLYRKQFLNLDQEAYKQVIAGIDHRIATRLARSLDPRAGAWLELIENPDATISTFQFRSALEQNQWQSAATFLDSADFPHYQYQYWKIRLEELMNQQPDKTVKDEYRQLTDNRNYYSFLSADRVGLNYQYHPINYTADNIRYGQLLKDSNIQKALELFSLNRTSDARYHWSLAAKKFDLNILPTAARLASDWNWYYQAISTLSSGALWDYVDMRFPRGHEAAFKTIATRHSVPVAWLWAITRQESAFNYQAISPAGARGLMQVMPSTARHVARKYQIPYQGSEELLDPELSIEIGATYLQDLLNRFDGNLILATAAYNAGPHRVSQWLKGRENQPFDVWIETIPFSETREYVKNVLTYKAIYSHQISQDFRLNPQFGVVPSISEWQDRSQSVNYAQFKSNGQDADNDTSSPTPNIN